MKKFFTIFIMFAIFLQTTWGKNESNTSWLPTPSWPFVYNEFKTCLVHTTNGKTLNVSGNIHIGNHYLCYKNATGKTMLAKHGTIKDLVFADGAKYLEHNNKLLKIISEDTVNNQTLKLLQSFEIDKQQYNELMRNKKSAEQSSLLDIAGLNDMNLDLSIRESADIVEQEPLPTTNIFYIMIGNDIFEARESNILKHLANKEERNAYRAYTRKAEIITGDLNSIINIYTTFFVKK